MWSWLLASAGILCLLYCAGILLSGVFGSWFFLVWGVAGAGLLALAWFVNAGMWSRLPFGIRLACSIAVSAAVIWFLFIEGLIISGFAQTGRPQLDCLIVLGAQLKTTGPSKALALRLDKAYEYLTENESTVVIVSGGQGATEPVSEAQGMRDYLVNKGIAAERIIMEDQSVNTHENLKYSRQYLPAEDASVGVVTNNFHIYRSVRLAKAQGYQDVCGIAADSDVMMQANNMLREFCGVMKDRLCGNLTLFSR